MVAMALLAMLPSTSKAQTDQCTGELTCCYCDLTVGQCKDISLFPGGGGTGYHDCYVNGMQCHYWGGSCRDEFGFEEVGPDGLLRVVSPEKRFPEGTGAPTVRAVVAHDGTQLERDCRRFVIAVKAEGVEKRLLANRTRSIDL